MDVGCGMAFCTDVAKLLEEYMFKNLPECRKRIGLSQIVKQADQRLTQAGFFLAFRRPGFFLSTRLASDVTVPAARLISNGYRKTIVSLTSSKGWFQGWFVD
jgi:hypothetical protein